ncbi:MAG: OST-HTH/LOTUS domain-containing protein, partial [Desulfobacterales bacterium]
NDFVFTNNLSSMHTTNVNEATDQKHEKTNGLKNVDTVAKFLVDAFNSISTSKDEWISLSKLGTAIKNEDPGFDPRSYGHRNLISLINSYNYFEAKPDDSTPPNYSVKLSVDIEQNQNKLQGTVKKFLNHYGFIEHKTGDYYFHVSNIAKKSQNSQLKKGTKVLFSVFKQPDPNEATSEEKNGKASDIEILENFV